MTVAAPSKRARVLFRLRREATDCRPADWESVWAIPIGANRYKIDDIPLYARSVALGDVFSTAPGGPAPIATELVEESGHSTLRVIVHDQRARLPLTEVLVRMGCGTELGDLSCLLGVDVPPSVNVPGVLAILDELERKGTIGYEVSCQAW